MRVAVKIWGTKVGIIGYESPSARVATFEYDENFLKMGVSLSPLKLPISSKNYKFVDISFRTFHGVAGFIADALPDKFGNQLIDQYFATQGRGEVTTLDRLLYIGDRAMGALEFEPHVELKTQKSNTALDLNSLSILAEMVISNKEQFAKELQNKDDYMRLIKIGSSAGGARSKALVAMDDNGNFYDGTLEQKNKCDYFVLKFDSANNSNRDGSDPKGMTKVEYIYSLIAKECSIDMADTSYVALGEDFHFLSKRFDRVMVKEKLEKLHYLSWCGLSHAHRDTTGAFGYEQLVMSARELGFGQDSVEEIFRRAIFNIVGRNQDDHTKNFGFLMEKSGSWRLSPAFDMTYSYDKSGAWMSTHQISLNLKQDNFTQDDIVKFGKFCNLNKRKSKEILSQTIYNFSKFEQHSSVYEVEKTLKKTVLENLRVEFI